MSDYSEERTLADEIAEVQSWLATNSTEGRAELERRRKLTFFRTSSSRRSGRMAAEKIKITKDYFYVLCFYLNLVMHFPRTSIIAGG